ncbi:ATP-binding protein, partial [Thermococci archaeon]
PEIVAQCSNPRKKRISREDLEITLNEALNKASELFEEIWDSLTLNQRKVLIAIARGEKDFYSRGFLNRYGFKRSSTVQVAIKGLKDKEIIIKEGEKYLIENPILELWVKRRF